MYSKSVLARFSILFISLLHKYFIKRSVPNQEDLKKQMVYWKLSFFRQEIKERPL